MTHLMLFRALVRVKALTRSVLVELAAVSLEMAKLARDGLQWACSALIGVSLYVIWVSWQRWLDLEELVARGSGFKARPSAELPNQAERRPDPQTIQ